MKITIRTSTERSFDIDAATPLTSVAELTLLCSEHPNLPTNFKLIHNGCRLTPPESTLLDLGIDADTALILMESQPKPKRAKKARCAAPGCHSMPLRMVGDCNGCKSSFCAQHRLMENHHCVGLQQCKESAHLRNATKLNKESTMNTS